MYKAQKDMKEVLQQELSKINTVMELYRTKNNELELHVNRLEKEKKLRADSFGKKHSKKEKKDKHEHHHHETESGKSSRRNSNAQPLASL